MSDKQPLLIEQAARDAIDIAEERDCHLRVAATHSARGAGCVLKQVDVFRRAEQIRDK